MSSEALLPPASSEVDPEQGEEESSEASKSFAHTITFGITLAIFTNIAQYLYHKSAQRKGSHWQRYGPVYVTLLAIPLVMADLTR
eukprot:jgi/Chlat1/7854/Chrsp66S09176